MSETTNPQVKSAFGSSAFGVLTPTGRLKQHDPRFVSSIQLSIQQTAHYSTQMTSLYRSLSTQTTRKLPQVSLMVMTTDQLL